jgi:hypothetical protein
MQKVAWDLDYRHVAVVAFYSGVVWNLYLTVERSKSSRYACGANPWFSYILAIYIDAGWRSAELEARMCGARTEQAKQRTSRICEMVIKCPRHCRYQSVRLHDGT